MMGGLRRRTSLVFLRGACSSNQDSKLTVVFSTEDQQATGGEDFIVQSINVTTFAPSETERFAAVGIMEDNVYEGTESFLGLLTPGSRGVRIEGGPATINIRDNDG